MKWFANLKMSSKLILTFGLIILILGFVIFQALNSLNKVTNMTEQLYNKHFKILDNMTLLDDTDNIITTELLLMYISTHKMDYQNSIKKIREIYLEQEKIHHKTMSLVQNENLFSTSLSNYISLAQEAKQIREEQIFPAFNADKKELAKKYILSDFYNKLKAMSTIIEKMRQDANIRANQAVEQVKIEADNASANFIGSGIIALILSIFLVYILNRLIAYPMNELSIIANKIANRDLIIPHISSSDRKDEVGILGNAFNIMTKNLKELVEELSNVINFLNTSSNEIVTASNQLASSASETATSINETTSTMEEVKQTSQVASKKAKFVSDAAQITSEMSNKGKKAASEMNKVVEEIHNQMNLIAETMMRLSEQTQTVGSIITTVEDLAQQTNLLAVNASIEASKAGDQGKGFSVVAQEVKSLATQSKQATAQVRTILNDIQKAASAAVMATELGSKSVEIGVSKTDEAGEAILTLVKTVADSAQAASQIATINHQQLVGMEQTTIAMDNIRQASNQNVESAKLLKDSMVSIKDLSTRLKQLVEQFKLH